MLLEQFQDIGQPFRPIVIRHVLRAGRIKNTEQPGVPAGIITVAHQIAYRLPLLPRRDSPLFIHQQGFADRIAENTLLNRF